MKLFRMGVAPLALMAAIASSQTLVTDITMGGKSIGSNTYETLDKGQFSSVTHIEVAGTKIDSELKGVLKDGMLTEIDITESIAKNSGRAVWKDGKLTAYRNGTLVVKDQDLDITSTAYFGSYHPQLARSIFTTLAKKGGAGELDVLNLSSMGILKMKFERTTRLADGPSGKFNVVVFKTEVTGIGFELAFKEDGSPIGMNIPVQNAVFALKGYEGAFVDPLSKYPELSKPEFKVETLKRVKMKTSDGVQLMADVLKPVGTGKYPTVLIRTPYGRAASALTSEWLARRGYAVVCQDVRGKGGSNGEWDPLVHEKADGKDTLDWIVDQPWSNGNVGMIGGSYLGYVQWAAASSHHPALKCIIPQVSPPPPDSNFPWDHGNLMLLSDLWWCRVVMDQQSDMTGIFDQMTNLEALKTLPLDKVDDGFFNKDIPFFDKWLKRPTIGDWKDVFTMNDVKNVKIPVLHVSGVWDGDGVGTMMHWQAVREGGGNQWVVFGPWNHLFNTRSSMGDVDYGPDSVLELDSVYLRFFDTYLKGRDVSLEKQPRVRFFETGSNKWIETSNWPMPGAEQTTLYLGGANAVGSSGSGALTSKPASGRDIYVYDPNHVRFEAKKMDIDPAGGTTKINLASLGKSALVYRSVAFTSDTSVAGPVKVRLAVSSSAKDASFHVLLCDQDLNGETRLICMTGSARATYVDGHMEPLKPGEIREVTVEPWWFAHRFAKGHKLVLIVQSDMFPQFARNPGTGEPDWKATKLVKARQSVWKSKDHPSTVTYYTLPD